MKKQTFHIGSFVLGLLAGGVILMLLALSQPLHTETQTSQLLRNESRQIQTSTSRNVNKTWLQVRVDLSTIWQSTLRDVSQSLGKDFTRVKASLHSSSLQPCTWLAWLDQQLVHLADLVKIHSFALKPPVCSS